MAYQLSPQQDIIFRQKEARDLFVRVVNTLFMSNKDLGTDKILATAKEVVDFAFKSYPAPETGGANEDFDVPIIDA